MLLAIVRRTFEVTEPNGNPDYFIEAVRETGMARGLKKLKRADIEHAIRIVQADRHEASA